MMHDAGQDRLPPVLHLLHLAQRQGGARGVPRRSSRTTPRTYMRPNFFVNTPGHPARVPAVRRPAGVQDPRRPRRDCCRRRWGVYSGYELFEHVAVRPGQRGVPRLGEVPVPAARLGGRRAEGRSLAPLPHDAQRASAASTRRCSGCATSLPPVRPRRSHRFSKREPTDGTTTPCSSSSTSTRTAPARPRVAPRPAGARARLARQLRGARRAHRARPSTWGQRNYVRLDPFTEPAHVLTVRSVPAMTEPRQRARVDDRSDAERDPHWYKRAVFYEVLVRGFHDCNGDGTGDLRGLTEKLDYLQWLGRRLPLAAAVLSSRRCATAATTSPTTCTSCRSSATSATSWSSSTRRTSAACASSPTWS